MNKKEIIAENFEAFEHILPELLKQHPGKFALLKDKKLVQVFDSAKDAMLYGRAQFPDDMFSIQEITNKIANLGFFSYAMPHSQLPQ